jgi:hypothetical protein
MVLAEVSWHRPQPSYSAGSVQCLPQANADASVEGNEQRQALQHSYKKMEGGREGRKRARPELTSEGGQWAWAPFLCVTC